MEERIKKDDIVRYFKWEELENSEDSKAPKCKFCYRIITTEAVDFDLNRFVVYQALYDNKQIWIRPYNVFMSEVDHTEYLNIKQKYLYEKVDPEKDLNFGPPVFIG